MKWAILFYKPAVLTVHRILDKLRATSVEMGLENYSDIMQLIGFCHEMDDSAFMPFSADDLGLDVARNIKRFYQVTDAIVDRLCKDSRIQATTKGLRAAPQLTGYYRYIKINGFGVSIKFDWELWRTNLQAATPFWLRIQRVDKYGWVTTEDIKKYISLLPGNESASNHEDIALYPPVNMTLNEITEQMTNDIVGHILKLGSCN